MKKPPEGGWGSLLMNIEDQERVLSALEVDTRGTDSPSGPLHNVLREFLAEGKVREFSEAYKEFRRQRPLNSQTTMGSAIAKLWSYWGRHDLIIDHDAWLRHRPDWSEELKAVILMPDAFEALVSEMDDEIRERFSSPVAEQYRQSRSEA